MYFLLFSMKKLLFFLLEKYVFPFILLLFFCEICISFYFAFIFCKICISFYLAFIFCKICISFYFAFIFGEICISFYIPFIFSKIFLKMVSCLAFLGLTQGDPDSRASDFLNSGPLNSLGLATTFLASGFLKFSLKSTLVGWAIIWCPRVLT